MRLAEFILDAEADLSGGSGGGTASSLRSAADDVKSECEGCLAQWRSSLVDKGYGSCFDSVRDLRVRGDVVAEEV